MEIGENLRRRNSIVTLFFPCYFLHSFAVSLLKKDNASLKDRALDLEGKINQNMKNIKVGGNWSNSQSSLPTM